MCGHWGRRFSTSFVMWTCSAFNNVWAHSYNSRLDINASPSYSKFSIVSSEWDTLYMSTCVQYFDPWSLSECLVVSPTFTGQNWSPQLLVVRFGTYTDIWKQRHAPGPMNWLLSFLPPTLSDSTTEVLCAKSGFGKVKLNVAFAHLWLDTVLGP